MLDIAFDALSAPPEALAKMLPSFARISPQMSQGIEDDGETLFVSLSWLIGRGARPEAACELLAAMPLASAEGGVIMPPRLMSLVDVISGAQGRAGAQREAQALAHPKSKGHGILRSDLIDAIRDERSEELREGYYQSDAPHASRMIGVREMAPAICAQIARITDEGGFCANRVADALLLADMRLASGSWSGQTSWGSPSEPPRESLSELGSLLSGALGKECAARLWGEALGRAESFTCRKDPGSRLDVGRWLLLMEAAERDETLAQGIRLAQAAGASLPPPERMVDLAIRLNLNMPSNQKYNDEAFGRLSRACDTWMRAFDPDPAGSAQRMLSVIELRGRQYQESLIQDGVERWANADPETLARARAITALAEGWLLSGKLLQVGSDTPSAPKRSL